MGDQNKGLVALLPFSAAFIEQDRYGYGKGGSEADECGVIEQRVADNDP